jgi:hypothetical protein
VAKAKAKAMSPKFPTILSRSRRKETRPTWTDEEDDPGMATDDGPNDDPALHEDRQADYVFGLGDVVGEDVL